MADPDPVDHAKNVDHEEHLGKDVGWNDDTEANPDVPPPGTSPVADDAR